MLRTALSLTLALLVFWWSSDDGHAEPTTDGNVSSQASRRGVEDSAEDRSALRVVGLLQVQLARDPADSNGLSLFVGRARVGLSGKVADDALAMLLVAELGPPSPRLLFASLDLPLGAHGLSLRVGRFKRPLSRSFLTSAGQLSMIDRPLTVSPRAFGDDVDVGVMLHDGGRGRLEGALGMFAGAPLTDPELGAHPVVAGRIGYRSPGLVGLSESDLEGGSLRVGVAVAGMIDLGPRDTTGPLASALVEGMIKVHGVSCLAAVHLGVRDLGDGRRSTSVGGQAQVGWVLGGRFEPVLRYVYLDPGAVRATHDFALGVNVFFRGHAFKWQTVAGVRVGGPVVEAEPDEGPVVRLQSQLGLMF